MNWYTLRVISGKESKIRENLLYELDMQNLSNEVGDVLVMIDLIKKRGLLKSKDLESRMKVKKETLKKWSNLVE